MPTPNVSPDQAAAHEFLSELRTRITTQPLPYQFGVEASALKSLWEVFGQARDAMKKHPGCEKFSTLVSKVLNEKVRPVTAKWHRASEEGELKSQDGAQEFRRELMDLQVLLSAFADDLHEMAYGSARPRETPPPAIADDTIDAYLEPLQFGIPEGVRVVDPERSNINLAESEEVTLHRKVVAERAAERVRAAAIDAQKRQTELDSLKGLAASPDRLGEAEQNLLATEQLRAAAEAKWQSASRRAANPDTDAIGLALSGGGIRSATFCMGVVQVLAQNGILREVDFLSTVSGGGYTGSFLTRRLGEGASQEAVAQPHGPDRDAICYVRQNAKFLAARSFKQGWSMATATLAGMVLNWMIPLLVVVGAAILAATVRGAATSTTEKWKYAAGISAVLSGVALYIYGGTMRGNPKTIAKTGWLLALLLGFTLVITTGWGLSAGYPYVPDKILEWWHSQGKFGALIAGAIAISPVLIRFLPILKNPAVRKIVLRIVLFLAGLIIPILGIVVFYMCWAFGDLKDLTSMKFTGLHILLATAVVLGVLSFFLLNINLTAPHRLYRDSLAKTFISTSEADLEPVDLKGVNATSGAPYHLINAALNIPSTQHPAVRDRLCDFFLFSKRYIGAPAIGYRPTGEWRANGNPADLATAMAVSGAAFSSYMGLGSFPTLTALLTFLNVRLGFWIRQPGRKGSEHPGFWCLMREMFGLGMTEKNAWLNLSDGGHIENLAIYELLRRRCKFIIAVDGEADPTFQFSGLMTLVRHAQIDLGVQISPLLDGIRPNPETSYSQSHFHFCMIHYPAMGTAPAGTGFLLYLKLSVTGNESELIHQYREKNPDFPHQTTLDQFFDQEQFEAYRQLGVHVAEGVFAKPFWNPSDDTQDIPTWFRNMAKNLLQA